MFDLDSTQTLLGQPQAVDTETNRALERGKFKLLL